MEGSHRASFWTRDQDKALENVLANFFEEGNDRWVTIATGLTGKTKEEVMARVKDLVDDVNAIESGCVPFPHYVSSDYVSSDLMNDGVAVEGSQAEQQENDSCRGKRSSKSDQKRKKGIPWTKEEHRLFLLGLQTHGKGDWKGISRNYVMTRTPVQIASHAQKYFNRQNSTASGKRRASIHDINTVDDGDALATHDSMTAQPKEGCVTGPSTDVPSSDCPNFVG